MVLPQGMHLPLLDWWRGLGETDRAAWAGAFASTAAVAVALLLALASRWRTWRQGKADSLVSAAFLYTEIVRLLSFLDLARNAAKRMQLNSNQHQWHEDVLLVEQAGVEVRGVASRLTHEHVRSLERKISADLAMTVGMLTLISDAMGSFAGVMRLEPRQWPTVLNNPATIVEQTDAAIANLRPFLSYCERRFGSTAHKRFLS